MLQTCDYQQTGKPRFITHIVGSVNCEAVAHNVWGSLPFQADACTTDTTDVRALKTNVRLHRIQTMQKTSQISWRFYPTHIRASMWFCSQGHLSHLLRPHQVPPCYPCGLNKHLLHIPTPSTASSLWHGALLRVLRGIFQACWEVARPSLRLCAR